MSQPLRRRTSLVLLIAIPLLPLAARSHHDVDLSKTLPFTRTGTITRISWDGPHVMYQVEVTDEVQEVQSWKVLGASPRILRGRGVEKSTFRIGDKITVVGRLDPLNAIVSPDYFISTKNQRYDVGFYPKQMRSSVR